MEDQELTGTESSSHEDGEPRKPAAQLSEVKRALLEKYLRGEASPAPTDSSAVKADSPVEQGSARDRAIPVQTSGSKPPFFFLHGQWQAGGFFCFPLARALGPDQPFYALDPYPLESGSAPPPLEAIAAAHVRSVRAVRPQGPYVLGGWCNGGLLAFEMARQMRRAGERVELLALIDPVYLVYPWHLRLVRAGIDGLGRLLGLPEDSRLGRYLWFRQLYRYVVHAYRYARDADYRRENRLGQLEREDYPGVYDWTAMTYRPDRELPAPITLMVSSGQPFRSGWREIEGETGVEVEMLSCHHGTCLKEQIDEFAGRLRTCLARRQATSAGEPVLASGS